MRNIATSPPSLRRRREKIKGKSRISFETYVQSMYFEQVIKAANARLSVMTGGRYELLRCQTASSLGAQTGLDLDVIDHYTGKSRSASSPLRRRVFSKLRFRWHSAYPTSSSNMQAAFNLIPCSSTKASARSMEKSLNRAISMLNTLTGTEKLIRNYLARRRAERRHRSEDRGEIGARGVEPRNRALRRPRFNDAHEQSEPSGPAKRRNARCRESAHSPHVKGFDLGKLRYQVNGYRSFPKNAYESPCGFHCYVIIKTALPC